MSRLGAPAGLCISGLLVLSACGSSKSASAAGDTKAATSATSSPAASGTPESVRIGPYTQVFATPLPANPAQAKVMEGFREAQILWEKSDNAWHLVAPVTDYVTGHALTHLTAAMTAGKAGDLVPAGTDRFFMTRVTGITGRKATVTTCDDGSKFKEENPRTGQVNAAYVPRPDQAYIFETWRMVQLSGHWAITDFSLATLPDPRAEPCQP
jgi:hypothetical protein